MQSLLILGRQPGLGLAELESLYGADQIHALDQAAAIVDIDPCLLVFPRLGGSQKFAKVLLTLETIAWPEIESYLLEMAPTQSQKMPEGKLQLGLSVYGFKVTPKQLMASGLRLKKSIQNNTGRSVRYIPNTTSELNSAQIIHNHLTGPNGWELLFVRDGVRTVIAQTVMVQDIVGYAHRDQERPKRDAKVGMLPPKLAQIIINLAVGRLNPTELTNICEEPTKETAALPRLTGIILDPFCGSGVILQEASLMGYTVIGSDIDERMVSFSQANYDWLKQRHPLPAPWQLTVGDATVQSWQTPATVASETYLGRPFTHMPSPEILSQTVNECNLIIKKFLQNWRGQIAAKTRLCIAVPAWQTSPGTFQHLPLIDQLERLGYNRVSFEHAGADQLIYYREQQIVARELLVLTAR